MITTTVKRYLNKLVKLLTDTYRDPRFIITSLFALVGFLITTAQVVEADELDNFEKYIFELINQLGDGLYSFFYIITQFGSLLSLVVWAAAIAFYFRKRAALAAVVSGFLGWLIAKPLKAYIGRARPGEILDSLNIFTDEKFSGLGYPSGHATLSAAVATAVFLYLKPKNRKYLLIFVALIGISRVYLGGHFPRDIIGGWFLGVLAGCIGSFLIGSSRDAASNKYIKNVLNKNGIKAAAIKEFSGDARGSRPIFITLEDKTKLFGKIVTSQEQAADWLFKTFRFFKYKNFKDEDPYLNPKRHTEHEAFVAEWARKFGVNTPQVIKIVHVKDSQWLLVQDMVDAEPLDKQKKVSQKTLEQTWRQILKLHDADIAHRDLRASNVLVDKDKQPWIIDFGFAEVAGDEMRKRVDIAEFLTTTSMLFGVKKSLAAALAVLEKQKLQEAAPYVQPAALSGATTSAIKNDKQTFEQLQTALKDMHDNQEVFEHQALLRITKKQIINLALVAVLFFIIIPQFNVFKDSFASLSDINFIYIPAVIVASMTTYIFAAGTITTIPSVPVSYRKAVMAQLAGSYASKLAPRGLGSSAVNLQFLRKQGMSLSRATSVMLTDKFLGFLLFVIPFGSVVVISGQSSLSQLLPDMKTYYVYIALGIILAGITVLVAKRTWQEKIIQSLKKSYFEIKQLAYRPRSLLLAALFSLGVTVSYLLTLYLCFTALQVDISILQIIVTYAAATFASSVTPTPGGLGGFEAGLIAAMVSFGVEQSAAYSVAILYRLATFWLPIPLALAAFKFARSKDII
ncbi:TPA: flippase-like domain-containing protein [Candidatus Saccharibacteria bacterium]|nr:flippase-like domain-containing protein [Candidatus Saccharibacteria bacterium]HIO88022.1 flippase-like domain-containing protein [Candidatus Saccharibacteria bacterium]